MTKLLDEAISKVRRLPPERQDAAAEVLMTLAEQSNPAAPRLTADQTTEVRQRLAAREFASDAQVAAFFRQRGA